MEANGCRAFPPSTAAGASCGSRSKRRCSTASCRASSPSWPRAAVAGQPVTRDLAGTRDDLPAERAPTTASSSPPRSRAARRIWEHVLGAADAKALDDLYAQLIWVPDGENDPLNEWAQALPRHHRPARPARKRRSGGGRPRRPARRRRAAGAMPATRDDGDASRRRTRRPRRSRLAQGSARAGAASRPAPTSSNSSTRTSTSPPRSSRRPAEDPRSATAKGSGTGAPSGRMPDRGVDRPPFPDEVHEARELAARLLAARRLGLTRIDKRTPGGRFDGRAYARRRIRTRHRTARRHAPVEHHARDPRADSRSRTSLLVVDTSGSMGAYEYALGPIVWILTTAFRAIDGKVATVAVRQRRRPAQRRHRPDAEGPGDPRRRRHRLRRRRHRPRRCTARLRQPAPTARRLRHLRRRLVRHARRRHRDPQARRPGRPDHPPLDRRRTPLRRGRAASASSPTPPTAWTSSPSTPSTRSAPRTDGGQPRSARRTTHSIPAVSVRARATAAATNLKEPANDPQPSASCRRRSSTSPPPARASRSARSNASRSSSSSSRPTGDATSAPTASRCSPACSRAPASSCPASGTDPTPPSRASSCTPASAACSPREPPTRSPTSPASKSSVPSPA